MAKPQKLPNGTWRIRWKTEHGVRTSQTFPNYTEASSQLKIHLAHVEEVRKGLRSPAPADKTFGELCDYWLEKRLPQKRAGRNDESIIRKHLRPSLERVRLRELNIAHTDEYQTQRAHLDKKTVANHLTLLISMLNTAVDLKWLLKAPKIKKPKTEIFSAEFRHLRSAHEITKFLQSANDEGQEVYVLYAVAVYTGARQGEIASLHRRDVDLERRIITIRRSFNGPTKAGYVRYVPE